MKRAILFAKGLCMGVADVIPGVSGGTLALILGIYAELVDTIKGLHLRWLGPLWRWLTGGRQPADGQALRASFDTLNLGFLLTLVSGIASAIIVGSMIIPALMERYPVWMRAFFFGLILASVWVPFRMIHIHSSRLRVSVVLMGLFAAWFGYAVSDPGHSFDSATHWQVVSSRGEALKDVARRGPSAWTSEALYWAPQNAALREAVSQSAPQEARTLDLAHALETGETSGLGKDELKARSLPYDTLFIPAGTVVSVPQPSHLFVLGAGAIAICAMILPGISGSYILLIMGAYFFILNALKSTLSELLAGHLPTVQLSFVLLFMVGAAVGLLSFSRLLSFLLRRHTAITLGALVGLMVGCLRGIWPFRAMEGLRQINVWPASVDATVLGAVGALVLGAAIVSLLSWLGTRYSEPTGAEDGSAPLTPPS